MSDKRISQLVARVTLANNDVFPIVASGAATTNKVTLQTIDDYMQTNLDFGVTSVAMSVPTGLTVTGTPITSTGTFVVTFTAGYSIPTTAKQTEWDTAYTNRITSATAPLGIASNVISITQSGAASNGYLSSTDWNTFNNKQATITTGNLTESTSSVLTITGGTSSVLGSGTTIQVTQASGSQDGFLDSADWTTFNGKQNALSGTGIVKSTGGTISYLTDSTSNWDSAYNDKINSAAVTGTTTKTLTLTQQDGGTITANWTDLDTGTVTSVGVSMPSAFSVVGSPITSSGTITITGSGLVSQYIDGTGALQTFPSGLPPTGAAGGDLSGTYPNPNVHRVHGIDMQSGTPTANDVWVYGGSPAKWQHQMLHSNQVTEDGNLFYTDARARAAFSESVTGLDYNSTTGVLSTATGYSIPSTASQTNWTAAYDDTILSAAVTGTTTKTLTLTQRDSGTITASWTDINTDAVTSVFGRTGAVVATSGDYNTDQVTEGTTNLYFTNLRARGALSFVAGSGAYNSTTGVITIPTNNNQITNGAGYITSYTETDTLASVTGRGASTSTAVTLSGGATITGLTIAKSAGVSTITFPQGFNDPAFIQHEESSNDNGIMRFSVGDNNDTVDYFVFGNTSGAASAFVERFKITSSGIINLGTWQGSAIADTYISSAATWNAKQAALNGTGFVKATGTTITYDNSTYLTTTAAGTTYVPYTGATTNVALGSNTLQVNEKIGTSDNKGIYLRGISDATHKIYFNTTSSNIILEYNNPLLFQFYNTGVPLTRFTFATNGDLTAVGNILGANLSGTNTGDQTLAGLGGVPTSRTLTINGTAYDLSANRSWTITAGVTGSGTATRVAFWDTTGSITSSSGFYWDNVNGRVAIGKNSADTRLEVYGSTKGQIRCNGGTAMGAGLDLVTELAGADRRNWAIFTENTDSGDFEIIRSSAAGGTPSVRTLTLAKSGEGTIWNLFNVRSGSSSGSGIFLDNTDRAGGTGRNYSILSGNTGAGELNIKDETSALNRFRIGADGVITTYVSAAIGIATDAAAYMRISENQMWRLGGGTLYINHSGSGDVVIAGGGGNLLLGTTSQGGGAFLTTKDRGITGSNTYFGTGQIRIGGNLDHTTNTVLSVAPGVVQFDRPGVAGGALQINSSGYVYVGTNSAIQSSEQFAVVGSGSATIFAKNTGGSGTWAQKLWNNATTGDNNILEFLTETTLTARGSIKYDRVGDMLNISGTGGGLKFSSNILSTGTLNFAQPVGIGFANGQYIKDNGSGGLFIVSGAAINMTGTTITGNTNFVIHSNGSASIGNSTQIGTLYIAGETTIVSNGNIRSNGGYMTLQSASGNVGVGMVPNLKFSVFNTGSVITSGDVTFATQAKGIEIYNDAGGTTDNLTGLWFSTGPHKAGIASGRDNASNSWGVGLRFFIHGPEISNLDHTYEGMRLNQDGNILLGTLSQNGFGSGTTIRSIQINGPSGSLLETRYNGTSGVRVGSGSDHSYMHDPRNIEMRFATSDSTRFYIYGNGNYDFTGTDVSDRRAKENIFSLDISATDKIMSLVAKTYNMKNNPSQIRYGFIAQDVRQILSDLVIGNDNDGYLGLDYNGLLSVAIIAIQEQNIEIQKLKNK